MISSTVATLPLPVFEAQPDGGKVRAKHQPAYRLLHDRPNPEQSSFVFREQMMGHLLLCGNFYAEIERNGAGDPVALWPLPPFSVRTERLGDKKVYVVRVEGSDVALSPDNVLHVQGFSLNGHEGLIPSHLARESIGLAKATETFGASFFGNGAVPLTAVSVPGNLTKEQALDVAAGFEAKHKGLSKAQRVAVMSGGMTLNVLGIAPEQAQFLETRKFQVAEVARLFLIPPHMIGDLENGVSYASIEQQAIGYVTHTIEPWTRRIEQEINYKLFGDSRFFAEFVLEGLLRGDSAARAAWYTSMANLGIYSVNEIRERENLNRIPEGDVRFMPMNMQELGKDADVREQV
jgi:HK97 family phage portal protein